MHATARVRCHLRRSTLKRRFNVRNFRGERIMMWDDEEHRQLRVKKPDPQPIKITLPDGTVHEGLSGQTTPLSVAEKISPSLARSSLVSRVNGVLHDMFVPLTSDSKLLLYNFDSVEGKSTFWHSSAHVLGHALEIFYEDIYLCDGPPLSYDSSTGTFFYEFSSGDKAKFNGIVSPAHFPELEKIAEFLVKARPHFRRMNVSHDFARKLFAYNPLKLDLLQRINNRTTGGTPPVISIYRCGDFIDLCAGPHITHAGLVKCLEICGNSTAKWTHHTSGTASELDLQRIYGVSFPDKKNLAEWKEWREEAEKRDHRTIGQNQKLWMFSDLSPGSPFFLPHGTRIYNKLMKFLRGNYLQKNYEEVITPLIFHNELWKMSGHWDHYKENMFTLNEGDLVPKEGEKAAPTEPQSQNSNNNDNQEHGHSSMALKPMNCPGHCLMFAKMTPSYRELPIRLADFSALHRNESSGSLRGLTRLRKFVQDDAHIFCRTDQIQQMIEECLQFVKEVYQKLGFNYSVVLSTRPERYMGDLQVWNSAEASLENTLKSLEIPFTVNPGDGAFYGPKIDVMVNDALKRQHQCGTIQLDFQLPLRFDLGYQGEDSKKHVPVIIHRAILGSIERFLAILTEHIAGKWPFWLSPRQAVVCNITQDCENYAQEIFDRIKSEGFFVDKNFAGERIEKKIRAAQQLSYNFILVVGKKEEADKSVNVRNRDGTLLGPQTVDQLIAHFKDLDATYK